MRNVHFFWESHRNSPTPPPSSYLTSKHPPPRRDDKTEKFGMACVVRQIIMVHGVINTCNSETSKNGVWNKSFVAFMYWLMKALVSIVVTLRAKQ